MPLHDRLRIALYTYATQPRGGVLHVLALAEALHALGHDVMLHALDDGRGFIRAPRCPHRLVNVGGPRTDIGAYVAASIAAYVRALDQPAPAYDVHHAHDGISGNALATLVERGRIARFVRTIHHLDDYGRSPLAALQDRSIRSAYRCLVVSDVWRRRVARSYGITATVVPNGVDTGRFSPLPPAHRERLRAALGYGPGPLFVTIGGIEPRKNSLRILEAFALVRADYPAARLIVAGGASIFEHAAYRRAFDARLAELGPAAGQSVVRTGVLSDVDIVALIRAAHAVVFPSLVEGFGLVVLEALACATPVITSALAPFTEYLSPGDALLVDPESPAAIAGAMLRALDPAAVAAAAARGPALAARYSWPAAANAHLAAYRAPAESAVWVHA